MLTADAKLRQRYMKLTKKKRSSFCFSIFFCDVWRHLLYHVSAKELISYHYRLKQIISRRLLTNINVIGLIYEYNLKYFDKKQTHVFIFGVFKAVVLNCAPRKYCREGHEAGSGNPN